MLTQEFVKAILHYDPETGVFTWLPRPPSMFGDTPTWQRWTTRFEGKTAGGLDGKGAVTIFVAGKARKAHHLAWVYMTGKWPKVEIDHEDTEPAHNWWTNLREATRSQQSANTRRQRGKGLPKGVTFRHGKYRARISVNGKECHLGAYNSPEEAQQIYIASAKVHYGEFANSGG